MLLTGCAPPHGATRPPAETKMAAAALTLNDQDNGRRVSAHVGDTVEVRLSENATTGYRWAPDAYDAQLLELAETKAEYPQSGAVGAGGQAIFHFRVLRAGSGALSLKYWRHWEGPGSAIQRFTVTIDAAK